MRSKGAIAMFGLAGFCAQAQETPGLLNSNYFVSSAIAINPSASADAKTFMQLNLAAFDVYAGNNVLFLPKYKFTVATHTTGLSLEPGINLAKSPKFAAAMASVEGPSFVFSKNNIGFGFFTRARAEADFKLGNVLEAGSLFLQDLQNSSSTNVNLRNSRAAAMAWTELGLNFSYMALKTRKSTLSVGGNLKLVAGAAYAYANVKQLSGFYNDSLIQVNNFNAAYRYTTLSYNYGKGLGLDLGITYKRMHGNPRNYLANSVRCNCEQMEYKYKIALSLHDMGAVRYTSGNAGSYSTSGTYYTNQNDTSYQSTVSDIENLSSTQKTIWASLPTELVALFDYNFGNKLYVAANLFKNLMPAGLSGVRGSNLFQVSPRFELSQFEFALPVSFIDFKKPITGVFLRVRGLGIGLDNIAPLLYRSNVSKAGIYFKWSISLNKNPTCKPKKYKLVDCPTKLLNLKK